MIEICTTCGQRKPSPDAPWQQKGCRDDEHTDSVAVTDNQARDLAAAAKAYNSARELEDRASAMNDWLLVLTDGLPAPETDQLELA